MPETKYIARRPGLFASLTQANELAGFRLESMAPASLRDAYFDTKTGALLRQGYALRVREQNGTAIAQLRALRSRAGFRGREADAVVASAASGEDLPELPAGELRDAIDLLAGDEPLHTLLRLRQDRLPRVVYDGGRLVGVISMDVVGYDLGAKLHVANEIEIELAGTGRERDLYRLDPVLKAAGLEATTRSKFERGVLRLQRAPDDPILLLPDERASLERMLESPDPALRRRARVVLLASRGQREETVSARAGLSPSRVRHWVDRFREGRMTALRAPDAEPATSSAPAAKPAPPAPSAAEGSGVEGADATPAYRVHEIVSRGVATPALFRAEHFDPESDPGFSMERSREDSDATEGDGREAAPPISGGDGSAPLSAGFGAGRPPRDPAPPEPVPFLSVIPVEPVGDEEGGQEGKPASAQAGREADAEAGTQARVQSRPEHDPEEERGGASTPISPRPPDVVEEVIADPGGTLTAPPAPADDKPTTGDAVVPGVEKPNAPPEVDAERSSDAVATAPPRPRFTADTPTLHAAARMLRYQYECFEAACAGLLASAEPAPARRALLAAHRVRLALETFESFLPEGPAEWLHDRPRRIVRALDTLVDLDAAGALLAAELEPGGDEARPEGSGGAPVRHALAVRRESARKRVELRLTSDRHERWKRRMERLLASLEARVAAGDVQAKFFSRPPDDYLRGRRRPRRVLLRHMLASAVWSRYEAVRTYERLVTAGKGDDADLRPLGLACAALGFVLGLASSSAPAEARELAGRLDRLESAVGDLHRARVAAGVLAAAGAGDTGRASPAALAHARASIADAFSRVAADDFRATLGRLTAAVG